MYNLNIFSQIKLLIRISTYLGTYISFYDIFKNSNFNLKKKKEMYGVHTYNYIIIHIALNLITYNKSKYKAWYYNVLLLHINSNQRTLPNIILTTLNNIYFFFFLDIYGFVYNNVLILDQSNKNKRSILFNKTFLINIVDKNVSSKVEKLIHLYGGVSFLLAGQEDIFFYKK